MSVAKVAGFKKVRNSLKDILLDFFIFYRDENKVIVACANFSIPSNLVSLVCLCFFISCFMSIEKLINRMTNH